MTISSTRGARSDDLHQPSGRADAAGFFSDAARQGQKRVSRFVAIVYVVVALATPFLLYAGPDVLSPAAPVVADKALDGDFAVHLRLAKLR
jgi:hypothetical protein